MNEFRVKLITRDGCLVQNRLSRRDMWFMWGDTLDKKFAEASLDADCREKGVKLLSWRLVSMYQIEGTVEWI